MADRYLLETSLVDGYLLEDGSGVLLLEVSVPVIEIPPGIIGGGGGGAISPHYLARGTVAVPKKPRRKALKPVEAEKKPPAKAKPKPKPKKSKPAPTYEVLPKIEIPAVTERKPKTRKVAYVFPEPEPAVVVQAVGVAFGTSEVIGHGEFSHIVEATFGQPEEITEEEFVFLALAA